MNPSRLERKPRASQQQFGRRRHEDFPLRCGTRNACGLVDREASNIGAYQFDLASVNAGPNRDAEVTHRRTDRLSASDGPSGPVEYSNEAVAGCPDLATAERIELASRLLVMPGEQFAPCGITKSPQMRGGIDYVGT